MKDLILNLVNSKNNVTFVELMDIPGFLGNRAIIPEENKSLIYWTGVSTEAIKALNALMEEKKIMYQTCDPILTYLIDGSYLKLPIAKNRHHNYVKPRWLPVTVNKWEKNK